MLLCAESEEAGMTFDLEKARADWDQIRGQTFTREFRFFRAVQNIPPMLAEIERLKSELESSNIELMAAGEIVRAKGARIKGLEEALAEYRKLGKTIAGKVPCLTLHGDCGRCSTQAREVCGALEQLAAGKIGPDAKPKEGLYGKYHISKADGSSVDPKADYFVLRLDADPVAWSAAREYARMTPNRKLSNDLLDRVAKYDPWDSIREPEAPRSWQITDERKAAMVCAIRFLPNWPSSVTARRAAAVLRTMLKEAGQ